MCLDMDRKVEDVINDILFVVWISKIKMTNLYTWKNRRVIDY